MKENNNNGMVDFEIPTNQQGQENFNFDLVQGFNDLEMMDNPNNNWGFNGQQPMQNNGGMQYNNGMEQPMQNSGGMQYNNGMQQPMQNSGGMQYNNGMQQPMQNSGGMQYNNGMQQPMQNNGGMQYNNGMQQPIQNNSGMQYNNGMQTQMQPQMQQQFNNGIGQQTQQMPYNNGAGMFQNNFGAQGNSQGMNTQIQPIDQATLTEYKKRLRSLPEVKNLTGEIEIQNSNSIIMFGQEASKNISKVSDELLRSMREIKAEETSEMLVNLTKIMDKFDIKELDGSERASAMSKIFKNIGNTVAKLFQKYDTMGYEVEKVYLLLKKYESDIREANNNLKKLYDANIYFYQMLEKYIVAGEIALEEIDQYINQLSMDNSMNQEEKQMLTQKLEMSKEMLSQRVYDLQIAENVAIQAAPMIQTIQMSNFNLMRKINSSFIITLPIFKQCLAQAIILKRQEIQAKSIKQLDDKTNELIMRNAQNTARQSVEIAKMASGSSINISTLEKSFETIMKGIEETKAIQEANSIQRKENSVKLENIKHNMKKNIASV